MTEQKDNIKEPINEEIKDQEDIKVENKDEIIQSLEELNKKTSYLTDLFTRRLNNDRKKDELINEVVKYLNKRTDLDTGLALADLFKELILVVDRLKEDPENSLNHDIAEEIITIFKRRGLEEIDETKLEDPINYEIAEVEESENVNEVEIAEVLNKGYMLGGKVIRTAKVKAYKPLKNEKN